MKEIQLDATYHSSQADGDIMFSVYDHGCSRCSSYEIVINNHDYDKYCVACVDSEYKIIPSGETRSFEIDGYTKPTIRYDVYNMATMSFQDVIESVRYLISDEVIDLFRGFAHFKELMGV